MLDSFLAKGGKRFNFKMEFQSIEHFIINRRLFRSDVNSLSLPISFQVQWDMGESHTCRTGHGGKCDLRILDSGPSGNTMFEIWPRGYET